MATHGSGSNQLPRVSYTKFAPVSPEAWQELEATFRNGFASHAEKAFIYLQPNAERSPIAFTAKELLRKSD